jgi:serine/threonine protein kinase
MSDPRWTTVDGLFEAALEQDPQERASFLREACAGNETLRLEVESLLAHAQAEHFLDRPAHDVMGRSPTDDNQSVGHSLGPYRIVGLLGRGGMGEVYRAHDTTLGRDVAIKILPSVFTTDPDRRARFDREARVLAALNHPHIGAIYGVQESDGIRALVLELVEGNTLADRIAQGALPDQEALAIARQIAEGLEAAHEKGVVHRDLKPANIKITPQGVVKVLDFGLAKATGDGSGLDLTQPPTATIGDTREGVILGTAAYMSPEQARGKPVDKRTDIWAFGCVLYEILTGRHPFDADSVSETLAKVIEREPDWRVLPAATPSSVVRTLQRCLDKDPNRRLHDIADVRIEIEDAMREPFPSSAAGRADSRQPGRFHVRWSTAAALGALVMLGPLMWVAWPTPQGRVAPRVSRMSIAASGAPTVAPESQRCLAITSDGTRIAYVGNGGRQIFVRQLDQLDPKAIVNGNTPLNWIFISPDNQWIGFDEGGILKKVAFTGGPAETIVNTGSSGSSATWLPDGTIIFATYEESTGLRRASADGGNVTVLTRPDQVRGERDHLWPEMLPGGQAVLFTITAITGGPDASQVAVLDLATNTSKVLIRGGSGAKYVPSGHLIYTAGGAMRAVSFDLARLEVRGTPVTAVTAIPGLISPDGASDFDVADDGTLVHVLGAGARLSLNTLVWVNRQGQEEPLAAPPRPYRHAAISPDGTRVAMASAEPIKVLDAVRPERGEVTLDVGFSPVWTRDGHRLLFFAATREAGLFWQAADGTGEPERLGTGLPWSVTPDGTRVLFSPPGSRDLMMLALDGAHKIEPLIQTPASERNGIVSPDGRWLAYESDSSGRYQIYVRPFPDVSAGQWLISTDGGTRPLWSPKNVRELFYVAPGGALMAVRVNGLGSTWNAGPPAKVLEGPYEMESVITSRTYDVSPDGQRFLVVKRPANQVTPQIVVVQNWLEELNRLVPPHR